MTNPIVSERAQHLLKVLVERYLRDGQPVGSKTLAQDANLPISPATIRNVMVALEDMGYVRSPHTSAGRVPTHLGLRLFVNSLVTVKPMDPASAMRLHQGFALAQTTDPGKLLSSASNLLSETTRMAGLVTVPKRNQAMLRQIEFLALGDTRVLVILVFSENEVQNRIIHTDRPYSREELAQASTYLNHLVSGHDLAGVRGDILNAMRADKQRLDRLMQAALNVAEQAMGQETAADYVMAGETHLVEHASELANLRELFEAFSQKQRILGLLDHCLSAEGVQIYIGQESGYEVLEDVSVVSAPYHWEGERVGVLAVVGPTRMDYERIIPVVDITAKLLSAALNHSL
ncbi:MAG: heat-inducible transcription repressor HrcA [Gammaproteobacteria bacterium]|nr:heat-inducible transcription repressor HrcA [Gammaproteobacteria bacterium]